MFLSLHFYAGMQLLNVLLDQPSLQLTEAIRDVWKDFMALLTLILSFIQYWLNVIFVCFFYLLYCTEEEIGEF